MDENIVLGVDVGGTHITIAPVDLNKRIVLSDMTLRISFDSNGMVEEIMEKWRKAIKKVTIKSSIQDLRIGFAFPAPFDYENGICKIRNQNKYQNFFNVNIRKLLAESLSICGNHIFFMNDAACFLKGELFNANCNNCRNPLGITLGTGLGSAQLINNKVTDAQLWNMPFKSGIAEDYLSTRWFIRKYHSITGKQISSVKQISVNCNSENLYEQNTSSKIFDEFGRNFADFIMAVLPQTKPDIIILGGSISKSFSLFGNSIKSRLMDNGYHINFYQSVLGEEAAVMGAASLCDTKEFSY